MIKVIFLWQQIDQYGKNQTFYRVERQNTLQAMAVTFSSFSNTSSGFNGSFEQEPEELKFRIANGVILIFLFLTTLLGNSVILITIWKTSALHSVASILLANLAVSDLAVGLFPEPLFITHILITVEYTVLVSLFYSIVAAFLSVASFITVTAIGIERLLALQLHMRYHAVVTPFRVTGVVIFIWALSGVIACSCLWDLSVLYGVSSAAFISLLVGNLIVYVKIHLVVRHHQRQIQHQQGNDNFGVSRFKKTALNTFFVYILLLFCYLPYVFVTCMAFAGLNFSPSVYFVVTTLVYLNSSLNPALYCWRDREIRTAVKKLLFRR